MYEKVTTARLSIESRNKLITLARLKGTTNSQIIKESLDVYYEHEAKEIDSFSLGEPFFGKYGSGENDRATPIKNASKEN